MEVSASPLTSAIGGGMYIIESLVGVWLVAGVVSGVTVAVGRDKNVVDGCEAVEASTSHQAKLVVGAFALGLISLWWCLRSRLAKR